MTNTDSSQLFHYTSVEAFEKMLKEMKGKESHELTFWASSIHYMNDPNEMSFLYDELMESLPDIENYLDIKEMPFSVFCSLGKNMQGMPLDLFKDI
jgi:hypothetical protein